MEGSKEEFSIGQIIRNELIRQERTVTWFARKISCSRTNAYKIFNKDNIDIKLLALISRVLEHDFFSDISDSYSLNIESRVENEG